MTRTVMIVDDEPDIVYMLKVVLRSQGFEVLAASGITQARSILAETIPDVVLLDLRLGDGEGWDVLNDIKSSDRLKDVPVIVLSAHASPSTTETAAERGAVGYVTKPFAAGDLLDAVRTHIRD